MNRIALRLSVGLLCTALIVLAAMPFVARWHFSQAFDSHTRLHDQLRAAAKLPAEERAHALRTISRSFEVSVDVTHARDVLDAEDSRPFPKWRGSSQDADSAFVPLPPPLGRRPGPRLLGMPFDGMVLVRVPGSDEVMRAGPIRPPSWPLAVILLGVTALVAMTGTLLARPLVRRLKQLQEAAIRIAKGELDARADVHGNDAISDFAAHFNKMADRNQALLDGQRDLMRGVSHELRTPVARIRFALELARESDEEVDRDRHLAAIDSDLEEIDALIQELLLVDRLRVGSSAFPPQAFDVVAVVRDEVERQRAVRPQIDVSLEGASNGRAELLGSERLFRRVVRNLVSNALRHAKTRVSVFVARSPAMIVFRVEDDGCGIPASERARILEPFVRLDESRSRQLGGVGLGLTIVDRILRAVGGNLRIDEASSGGASVAIEWPREGESPTRGHPEARKET
jgi:signal transduction histidine kinase